MSKLSKPIESKSKFIIWKRLVYIKSFLGSDSNFKFVFCSSVRNNFPIMYSIEEWSIRCYSPKIIISFIQKCMFEILAKSNFFWRSIRVPRKLVTGFRIQILYLVFNSIVKLVFIITVSMLSFKTLIHCSWFLLTFF
jgi:hypothetical protein